MAGVQINGLTDFVLATSPAFVTGPDVLLNEGVKTDYPMLQRFLKGRDMSSMLQGGKTINDQIVLEDQSTASDQAFGATLSYTNVQNMTEISVPWRRKVELGLTWTDAEVLLQGTQNMTSRAKYTVFKNVYNRKEQGAMISLLNSVDSDFWAMPQTTVHESASGNGMIPIPAYINEYALTSTDGVAMTTTSNAANTLFNPGTSGDATIWTTVAGVSPLTKEKWRNKIFTYQTSTPNSSTNVFSAFDRAWLGTLFKAPPTAKEYFEESDLFGQCIYTSNRGVTHYQDLLRQSNDRTPSSKDPAYNGPTFNGVEVKYVPTLDTALLYPSNINASSGARVSEGQSTTARGPRYYWVNGRYMTLYCHSQRYFYRHEPLRDSIQPDTWKRPIELWRNLLSRTRQRHAIVSPTNATAFATAY